MERLAEPRLVIGVDRKEDEFQAAFLEESRWKHLSHERPLQMHLWEDSRKNEGNEICIKQLREENGYASVERTPSTARIAPSSMPDSKSWKTRSETESEPNWRKKSLQEARSLFAREEDRLKRIGLAVERAEQSFWPQRRPSPQRPTAACHGRARNSWWCQLDATARAFADAAGTLMAVQFHCADERVWELSCSDTGASPKRHFRIPTCPS